jgi:alkylation response protein AidB-like acyl-CoA dehydrogenase
VAPASGDSAGAWRERARAFAAEQIAPIAEEIDRTDRLPEGLRDALGAAGFMSVGLPEEWGGRGGDTRAAAAVIEEIARASAVLGTLVSVHLSVCAQPIARWGTRSQKEEFLRPLAEGRAVGAFGLSEPGVGSDAARLACRYRREGDGFVLQGTKMFITNASVAGVLLTFATVDPSRGREGISAFLVPRGTAGFSAAHRLEKLGWRGSETNEVVFDGARLPARSLLGKEGEGLHIALESLSGGRVGISACALGVATAAYDELLEAVRADPQAWKRAVLARAFTMLSAARGLVERAAERKDLGEPFVAEASAAKIYSSEAAVWIAHRAIDVAGPSAVRSGSRSERLLRDARAFPIVEGSSEIQELILSRALLGP